MTSRHSSINSITQLQRTLVQKPAISVSPIISGDSLIGSMLSSTQGTWLYNPGSYSYQWQRNGSDIGSATNSYYILVASDELTNITCKIGATNEGGTTYISSNIIIPAWSPAAFGSNLILWLDPANVTTMLQEQYATNTPITAVTADTNPVGLIYDRGYHGYTIGAEADTRRPLLGSDGTRNSYITFDGSNDYLRVLNVAKYLAPCHNATPTWTLMFWYKSALDGTSQFLINSNSSTTANAGISVQKTTANKLTILVSYASAGNNVCSFTTTNTITTASGWTPVIITINSTGANHGSIIIGNNSAETFTVNAGSTVNATNDLFIGCEVGPTAYTNGSFGDIVITNTVVSGGDITKFKAYNPTRSTNNFTPILQWNFDFNNSSYVFADNAFTTPITNSTAIQGIKTAQASIFGELNRTAISAGSGTSPIWNQSFINSNSVATFDNTHPDNLAFIEALTREQGGKWTIIMVTQNVTHNIGSHLLTGGTFSSHYWVETGRNYPGNNINNGKQYTVIHTASQTANLLSTGIQGDALNICIMQRDGTTFKSWTTDGTTITDTGITSSLLLGAMGNKSTAITPNFNLNGPVGLMQKWIGIPSANWITDNIVSLKSRFGIIP